LQEYLPGAIMACISENADGERMSFRNYPFPIHRGDERELETLEEALKVGACMTSDCPEASEDDDALIASEDVNEEPCGLGDCPRIRDDRSQVQVQIAIVVDGHAGVDEVLGHRDVNGARPAVEREVDRLLQHRACVPSISKE